MDKTILNHIREAKPLTSVGSEATYQLPLRGSKKFAALFKTLEKGHADLGIQSFGLSVTTLEEVFIRVADSAEPKQQKEPPKKRKTIMQRLSLMMGIQEKPKSASRASMTSPPLATQEIITRPIFWVQLKALLIKRCLCLMRDTKMWVLQFLLPTVLVLAGLLISKYVVTAASDQPSLTLSLSG